MSIGLILMYIVAGIQLLVGVMLLLGNQANTFETDTGVAWAELSEVYPSVAVQFSMANMGALVANLALALLSLAVIHFAFREGQTWAWFALWLVPLNILPGVINLARSDNPVWVAVFGGVIMMLAGAGLILTFRDFFPSQ